MPARMRRLARLIASGFGSGYCPKAPGTAGSLLALAAGAGMLALPPWVLPVAICLSIIAGLWAIGPAGGTEDPGWVVIDEFAGQWIALLPLSAPTPLGLLAAFALFRLFDITKPGPVGWADRQHGAFGVMADDVIAGLIAAALLEAAIYAWPALLR
jgi:phosphatidylglycerophosphatase A